MCSIILFYHMAVVPLLITDDVSLGFNLHTHIRTRNAHLIDFKTLKLDVIVLPKTCMSSDDSQACVTPYEVVACSYHEVCVS